MKLNDFKVGDLLLIHYNFRNKTEIRAARVFDINYNDNGLVTYEGDYKSDFLQTGQGAFNPERLGDKKYGIVKVERVGFRGNPAHWSPKPGDRAYDLMC